MASKHCSFALRESSDKMTSGGDGERTDTESLDTDRTRHDTPSQRAAVRALRQAFIPPSPTKGRGPCVEPAEAPPYLEAFGAQVACGDKGRAR
jgi:hypothetical protein